MVLVEGFGGSISTKISLFAFFVRGRISWRSDERKIFCFQVEQSSGNFLTKTKKFIFLVEIPFEILPTITNKSSFLVEHKEMNFIGELMKAVHKRNGPHRQAYESCAMGANRRPDINSLL